MKIQLYSLSARLTESNAQLSDCIAQISPNDLYSSVIYNQSAYILFDWDKINYIKKAINSNNTANTFFICIDKDISPENRLYLLNNNIEYITLEKFSQASIDDISKWSKREKHKILLIEDDGVQAIINETLLKNAGIQVKTIKSEADTLDAIATFNPDLLLIDLEYLQLSGQNILNSVRSDVDYLSMPIVVLNSDESKAVQMQMLDDGADEVINKPIKSEVLLSKLLNRMQGQFFHANQNNIEQLITPDNHKLSDFEYDSLRDFILSQASNPNASIIWIKIVNKKTLQKTLGLSGFRNLSSYLLLNIPDGDNEFALKLIISDGVYAFASENQSRSKARKWVDFVHKWLSAQSFNLRNNDSKVLFQALILSDLPKKSNKELLVDDTERILLNTASDTDNAYIGEGDEQKKFYLVKTQLENAIKSQNFKWYYQSILNTKQNEQEIFQLMMRVITEGKELISSDYFEVANEAGLLQLLDRFTLDHAINIIKSGETKNIERRVLLNQVLNDYESESYRIKTLEKIKVYQLPARSLIFQFRQDFTEDHLSLIETLSQELKQANITICLSEFDASDLAWTIAKTFKADWIRIKPFDKNSKLLNKTNANYIGTIVKKAQKAGYKVMLPNIDSANLTANIWNLGADYIQGNFIQAPVSNIKYIEEATG